VLAAFAFAALVFILTVHYQTPPTKTQQKRLEQVTVAFFVAFLCLTVCSLMFAALAGENASRGRAATETLLAGTAFAMAAFQLMLGIVLLLDYANLSTASTWIRIMAAIAVSLIAFQYITTGALDVEATRAAFYRGQEAPVLAMGYILLSLFLPLSLLLGWRRSPGWRSAVYGVSLAGLILVFVDAIILGFVSGRNADFIMSTSYVYATLIVLFVVMLCFAIYTLRTR
jgi:hypothetical protein